jgi:hypothetical protein
MAIYRPIYTSIWKDPDFETYKPMMKLIFIYLCTNESTTESGIYPITIKTISNETGISNRMVNELLSNGLKNVLYDFDNSCVFVKNFYIYNGGGRPDLLEKSIIKNFKTIFTPLWKEFIKIYPQFTNCLKTVSEQFKNSSLEIEIDIRNRNSNRNRGDNNINRLSEEEKANYKKGMDSERDWNRLKEKKENNDISDVVDIKHAIKKTLGKE